jgi:hypothetical protein
MSAFARRGCCRGAVVLLQAHELRAGKVALEAVDVLDARAAPAIDRLIVVADDERDAAVPREQRSHEYWIALVSWNSSTSRCRNAAGSARAAPHCPAAARLLRSSSSAKSTTPARMQAFSYAA